MTSIPNQELFEQVNNFNKLMLQISQRIQASALEMINECMAANSKRFEEISGVKNPEQLMQVQIKLLNEAREQLINNSQKALNLSLKNFADLNQLFEKTGYMMNPLKSHAKSSEKSETSSKK